VADALHHAIIVTSSTPTDGDADRDEWTHWAWVAWDRATDIFDGDPKRDVDRVTHVHPDDNECPGDVRSFVVLPHGHPEGSEAARIEEQRREQLIGWLREHADVVQWAEVRYGAPSVHAMVIRSG
jgi:hypothetical protein